MKVPKMYKSSDRFNVGVDVIYDDESKLQYAPFIYATTESGDSGADDEEGEDTMIVNLIWDDEASTYKLDKTWSDINAAVTENKLVLIKEDTASNISFYIILRVETESGLGDVVTYIIEALGIDTNHLPKVLRFNSDSDTGTLILVESSGD